MLWTPERKYLEEPFEREKDLEAAVAEVQGDLFGPQRIYLETKRLIGTRGVQQNIPDAYVLDLTSARLPKLFVVETELGSHEPLKHIAVQILQFSLAFELDPRRVKSVLRDAITKSPASEVRVTAYAQKNGFENLDYLLEQVVHRKEAFNALVIIDESVPELENVLLTKFQFPVEIITLKRFVGPAGERVYDFEPLLREVDDSDQGSVLPSVDPAELDTIVVPAQEEGFQETAIGENRWHHIRISAAMIPQIRYLATYRVSPLSAITHWAPVAKIQPWEGSSKYELIFSAPLEEFPKPICLVPNGKVKALQTARYASLARLKAAVNLDSAF